MAPHHATYQWREVSAAQLDQWLTHHAGLEARPPLSVRDVNFREWSDPSLGQWPDNVVAKMIRRPRGKGASYQIRVFEG